MANVLKDKFNVYYQNVRGLRTKTDIFYRQMACNSFDVIVLTETWLLDGISNSELFDNRYIVWRRDRDYGSTGQTRGGGVLIATRRDLSTIHQPLFQSTAEDLWLTIRLKNLNTRSYINLCVIYLCKQNLGISFSTQVSNFLLNLNRTVMNNNNNDTFLVLGDFNMSGINWLPSDNLFLVPSNIHSHDEYSFTDELNALNLQQYNGVLNGHGKILDLVLSNNLVTVSEWSESLVPIDAYHPALLVNVDFLEVTLLECAPRIRYLYDKGDYDTINDSVRLMDWEREFSNRTIDESVDFFNIFLSDLQTKYIPQKTSRNKLYPVWYSTSLIKCIKEKYKYLKKFKLYGNKSDELTFKLLRERVKLLASECYASYLKITEDSIKVIPKHFWSFVKNRHNSNAVPSTLTYENQIMSSGVSICEAFSKYFLSNFLNPSNDNPNIHSSVLPIGSVSSEISNVMINTDYVHKLLAQLDTSKAAGPDSISPNLLTRCSSSLAYPVSLLFKKSLSSCVVPKQWKSAFITPIHKKGAKTLITNYRPISKLCLLAKVLERVVYNQVYAALRNSMSPLQHGFLKGKSTVTNLVLLNDYITEVMDGGGQVDVVYTDYSKAFDRIDHRILISKINTMGVHGDLLRWFSSYLDNRSQAVVLNNYISSWVPVPSGCPQGSLLGPLLFVAYINDIDSCLLSSKLLCFADDMKIYAAISSIEDMPKLQADLERLEEYCRRSRLDLNPAKCSVVTYSRKRSVIQTSYTLGGQPLPRVSSIRDLGVHHDSKLLFETHVDNIVSKATKSLGFIMRVSKSFKNAKTLKILYCTFVRSQLEYASEIWNPCYQKYVDR
ncbi:uncharacterized protein LOC113506092 [Trichoplusia ni]|uniref:Uncharacterized protein LOC113506092 n=1 Tax=Trichoplusia ni TaxID=7111 RepID=A0A7E5WWT2_TRINI|nr:uncharacterized protein LOC113506092 [Trichoplusia ni]